MARPKKEGLDYFSVDVEFDEKVESIVMIHKNDGLAWVIRFWQKAYKTLTGVVDFSGLFAELFANKCRITLEEHNKILNTAISVEFCYEIETDKYTSHGIQKRISAVSKDRSDAIERQKESTKENKKNKEKKSIVKQSKVKETPHYSANNTRITPEESKPIENIEQNKTWRDNFEVYLSILRKAFLEICENVEWIKKQEKFNPNVDIPLSIEKSIENFWGKEGGWKNKKGSRTLDIDWPATFANAVSMPNNRVWKQQSTQNNKAKYGQQEVTKEDIDALLKLDLK